MGEDQAPVEHSFILSYEKMYWQLLSIQLYSIIIVIISETARNEFDIFDIFAVMWMSVY